MVSFLPQIKKKKSNNTQQPHWSSKQHWNQLVILQPKSLPTCRHVLIAFQNELQAHVAKKKCSRMNCFISCTQPEENTGPCTTVRVMGGCSGPLQRCSLPLSPGNRSNLCQNGKSIDKPTCCISPCCPDLLSSKERDTCRVGSRGSPALSKCPCGYLSFRIIGRPRSFHAVMK